MKEIGVVLQVILRDPRHGNTVAVSQVDNGIVVLISRYGGHQLGIVLERKTIQFNVIGVCMEIYDRICAKMSIGIEHESVRTRTTNRDGLRLMDC